MVGETKRTHLDRARNSILITDEMIALFIEGTALVERGQAENSSAPGYRRYLDIRYRLDIQLLATGWHAPSVLDVSLEDPSTFCSEPSDRLADIDRPKIAALRKALKEAVAEHANKIARIHDARRET